MIKEEREVNWVYDSGPVKVESVDLDNRHPYGNVPSPTEYGWKNELRAQGITDWEVKPLKNGDFEIEYNFNNDLCVGDSIDWNITIDESHYAPLCEVFRSSESHNHFVMYNSKNEMMVDMDLDDGTIIFGENYTPTEAAKTFWDTIGKMSNRPEAVEEYYVSAPPGIADDMPEEYMLKTRTVDAVEPLTGWTLVEDVPEYEIDEDLIKDVVKDIQATRFDDTMKGLIDG